MTVSETLEPVVTGQVKRARQTMLQTHTESAELEAAKAVKTAFAQAPTFHTTNLDAAVLELWAAGKVDGESATYVLRHADRFRIVDAPEYFTVSWLSQKAS